MPSVSFMMLALWTAVTFFTAVGGSVIKGKTADALAGGLGDELYAVGDLIVQHVLDAFIQVLGVFAHNNKVPHFSKRVGTPGRVRTGRRLA